MNNNQAGNYPRKQVVQGKAQLQGSRANPVSAPDPMQDVSPTWQHPEEACDDHACPVAHLGIWQHVPEKSSGHSEHKDQETTKPDIRKTVASEK